MDALLKSELSTLMQKHEGLCVSIFLPTHRSGAEVQQNQIRLRKLLREAEERLIKGGLRPQEAKTLMEPASGLVNNLLFWKRQSDGLALFLHSGVFKYYCLPLAVSELIVVADRFHVKPLLPALNRDERFYVLALSQNEVRLLQGTGQGVTEIDIDSVPKSLAEALQYDERGKQIRFRAGSPGSGERGTMLSGHGADVEDGKDNLLRYFRQIDKGLRDLLREQRVPLILAGVDYLFPIYNEVNTYPFLLAEGVAGNPKGMNNEQIHRQAWQIVRPYFQRSEDEALAQYRQSQGTGLTSNDIAEIVSAAAHGRVGLLFVALGLQQWGLFDPEKDTIQLQGKRESGSEDLLDFAAIQTYLNGGTVFALPAERMPDGLQLAAVFRY